jgi:hypothetical protein
MRVYDCEQRYEGQSGRGGKTAARPDGS